MDILLKKETKYSRKILFNYIRVFLPKFYLILLEVRFFFFKKKCSTNGKIYYSDGCWLKRKTSKDLIKITEYFIKNYSKNEVKVLQIGVGNSSFYKNASKSFCYFYGVTIVFEELEYGLKLKNSQNHDNYHCELFNKYELSKKLTTDQNFDYIIDNDLSSYCCCKFHFSELIKFYSRILTPLGKI